jgi:hypothetical protein
MAVPLMHHEGDDAESDHIVSFCEAVAVDVVFTLLSDDKPLIPVWKSMRYARDQRGGRGERDKEFEGDDAIVYRACREEAFDSEGSNVVK